MPTVARRVLYMLLVTVVAVTAASAGVMLWRKLNPPPEALTALGPDAERPAPSAAQAAPPTLEVGARRPDVQLRDLDDRVRSISEWDGQLLVVNFWATWCPPCLEEIPGFIRLQEAYRDLGVAFLGIALDSADNVRNFVERHGLNYPTLHGEKDAIDASKAFGNSYGALPFTAVVGRDGRILKLHGGVLDEDEARALIEAHS